MLEEKENLRHEIQAQEQEFKLQNQTVMEELTLVRAIECAVVNSAMAPSQWRVHW